MGGARPLWEIPVFDKLWRIAARLASFDFLAKNLGSALFTPHPLAYECWPWNLLTKSP
jgi:hypothetical protein